MGQAVKMSRTIKSEGVESMTVFYRTIQITDDFPKKVFVSVRNKIDELVGPILLISGFSGGDEIVENVMRCSNNV